MTLKTIADMLWACGLEVRSLEIAPMGEATISSEQVDRWLDCEPSHEGAKVSAELVSRTTKDLAVQVGVEEPEEAAAVV